MPTLIGKRALHLAEPANGSTTAIEAPPMEEKTRSQVAAGGESEELEKAPATSGTFYAKVRLMRKHPTVKLARALAAAPLLASRWSIESNDTAPDGAKELIHTEIIPNRTNLLRHSLFGCMDYGWQSFEKVLKYIEQGENIGKVGVRKLKPLIPDKTKILIDPKNGSFAGLLNFDDTKLEIAECLLVNAEVEGTNWYGIPDMEAVEGPYNEWTISNTANKTYDKKIAGAHWIIHYPPGVSNFQGTETDNYDLAVALLNKLEASGSFVVPRTIEGWVDDLNKDFDAWKIELITADASASVGFVDRLNYLDKLMVRAYGMPERAVLEGQFGTKAEAEAHADIAITNMELRHEIFIQQYNWYLVNQLLRLNYGPEFENSVWIVAAPIADLALQYLRKVYETFLGNPQGFATEFDNIDMRALRDRIAVPTISDGARAAQDQEAAANAMQNFTKGLIPAEE